MTVVPDFSAILARGVALVPDRPGLRATGSSAVGRARLPTEPIGTTTVTFSGVVAGSEIRVYLSDATEVAGIESCSADQVLAWDAYAVGSANNNVTIRIVNNAYKVREIAYTTRIGAQSIPIQQDADRVYLNP